jgi:type IV pilus assembly protein PilW
MPISSKRGSSKRNAIRGFSLVELMVALTLSLILLGGVLSVTISSKVTYRENERVARLQENMRAGFEIILRDLRGGGFPGCARPLDTLDFLSVLANKNDLLWNFSQPVQGFDANGTGWSPALVAPLDTAGVTAGNDVIVIRTMRSNSRVFRLDTSMVAGSDAVVIKKTKEDTLRKNVPMLISDCEKSTVFSVTDVASTDETATLTHADGGANSKADISIYQATTASVAPIDTIVYYIAPSSALGADGLSRGPALWRISATEPTANPGEPQEVVEGVERLQAVYGEDTNGDMVADAYNTASAVTNWNRVVAVSLAVVVRSPEETNPEAAPEQTFDLLGTSYKAPSDRRRRALFSTTIALRNRTL